MLRRCQHNETSKLEMYIAKHNLGQGFAREPAVAGRCCRPRNCCTDAVLSLLCVPQEALIAFGAVAGTLASTPSGDLFLAGLNVSDPMHLPC